MKVSFNNSYTFKLTNFGILAPIRIWNRTSRKRSRRIKRKATFILICLGHHYKTIPQTPYHAQYVYTLFQRNYFLLIKTSILRLFDFAFVFKCVNIFFFLLAVKVSMITIEIFSFDSNRHFKLETEDCKSLVLFSTDVTSSSIRMLLKGKGTLWQLKGCQKWACAGRREDDFILLTWINRLKTGL